MLFTSWTFIIFFVVFYSIYLGVKNTPARLWWLLAGSYFFYGWLNPLYPVLLIFTTLIAFFSVVAMEKTGKRRFWLGFSILNALGLLGFCKYGAFVVENCNALLSALGTPYKLPEPGLLFPVGISFFTFQALSYVFDYYRGNILREKNLLRFATFVGLFPQLLSGPIERSRNLLPQLAQPPAIAGQAIGDGFSLFLLGMFKKVILADYLGLYVNKIYANPGDYHASALLIGTVAFAWQIYFDFSGYTDMARGIARLLGYNLMLNFNHPYLATSLGDFWNRWHISLSTWFKDYVYIPLGGNRKGPVRTYINIFLTMLISGLWHGAAWTFVIWGVVHASGRFVTRAMERSSFYETKVPKFAKRLFVFGIVTFAWIFFKASSLNDALLIVRRIFTSGWTDPAFPAVAIILIIVVWAYQTAYDSWLKPALQWAPVRVGLVVLMILAIVLFPMTDEQTFIYFRF